MHHTWPINRPIIIRLVDEIVLIIHTFLSELVKLSDVFLKINFNLIIGIEKDTDGVTLENDVKTTFTSLFIKFSLRDLRKTLY